MLMLLIIGIIALLLISAALAPLESLSWYAGWYGQADVADDDDTVNALQETVQENIDAQHFAVYLSGIGAISGDSVPHEEIVFLDALEPQLAGTLLVRDVFPYSVSNKGLNGQRFFAAIWRWLEQRRLRNPNAVLANLVNIRNMFQVAVSADSRYGPVFNLGVAQEIVRGLVRHGYRVGSGTPVTLIGWSGGGQISVGAATYLYSLLGAPIRVISVGGVMADDPGLLSLVHLYYLYGNKDPVQRLGAILYAGRWPAAVQSPWNRAKAAGRISLIDIGPITHNNRGHYFDTETTFPDGQSYAERTQQAIISALEDAGLMAPSAPQQPAGDD
jgi:hypothetical protein